MAEVQISRVDLIFRIVQTFLSLVLLVGLYFAYHTLNLSYQTLKSDHDQRRRAYSMHLYDEWRKILDLTGARLTLEKIRSKELLDSDLKAIAAGKAVPGKFSKDQAYEMRQHIVSILNLFEQIAVGDRDHVGDREMIRRYFSKVIMKNRELLQPFVHEWVVINDRESWTPLDDIIKNGWNEPIPNRPPLP